jgi:hypothetical protein
MKKILALIVIGVIGYFGYGYYTNNNVTSTDNGDDYIMVWSIANGQGISLEVTGGEAAADGQLSPPKNTPINEGHHYDYVVFKSLNVDIYTGASGGGEKLGSTVINMATNAKGDVYPLDSKNLLTLKYNPGKSQYPAPGKTYNLNWFDITYNGTPPPTVITNNGWNNGLGNTDEVAKTNESFFVADYGEEKGRWTTNSGAIYQTTKVISSSTSSRIYPVKLVQGNGDWSFEQGIGVAKDGLWQIDIQIGSDGKAPFCETFYLAERKNLAPGVPNYLDGNGGGTGGGGYGREIDVMETQWQHDPAGPQASLANHGGNPDNYWNKTELQNVRIGLWSDIGGAPNSDFATYGVLIRDNNLWIYTYKPDGSVWYCSDAVPNTNTEYTQEGNFVAYIGTWRHDPQDATTGFSTGYNNFIYLAQDDPKIKGKNPKDNPEFFGKALK